MKVTNMHDLLGALNAGKLKIKYNGWSFSGRDYGDFDDFDILENDEKLALLRISTNYNRFEYCRSYYDSYYDNDNSVYSQDFNFECSDYDYDDICDDIYDKYLPRDDAEFCAKLTGVDGMRYFPRKDYDVSREDVMSGKWLSEYNSLNIVQNVMQQAEEIENSQKQPEADFVFWEG